MLESRFKFFASIFTFAPYFMVAGCHEYPAVGTLAASMQKNIGTWQPFVDDYAASCKRRVAMKAVVDLTDTTCDGLDDQAKRLNAAFKVLDNYFGALAAVASDSKFVFDAGIDGLAGEAKQLKADTGKVDAITALAKTLADLAAAGMRKHATRELIAQSGNASTVVDTIKDIFDHVYLDNLKREAGKWQENMQHAANGLGMPGQPPMCSETMTWTKPAQMIATAQQLQFQRFYNDQCYKINARTAALKAFDYSADQIEASLKNLGSSETRLSYKEVIKDFLTRAKTLVEQAKAIDMAFNPTSQNS